VTSAADVAVAAVVVAEAAIAMSAVSARPRSLPMAARLARTALQ